MNYTLDDFINQHGTKPAESSPDNLDDFINQHGKIPIAPKQALVQNTTNKNALQEVLASRQQQKKTYPAEESGILKKLNVFMDKANNAASLGLLGLEDKTIDYVLGKMGVDTTEANRITTPETDTEKNWGTAGTVAGSIASLPIAGKAVNSIGKAVIPAAQKVASPVVNTLSKLPTSVKVGTGIGAAATGYETFKGATDEDYANERQTLPSQIGASLRSGTGDLLTNAGSIANWQGQEQLGENLKNKGADISKGYEVNRVPFTWKSLLDPDWYANNVASTVPSTAALIPLMYAGYKGAGGAASKLGAGPLAKTIIASLGGTTLARPLESAMEAGSTFDDAISRGMTEEEADTAANQVFVDNLKLAGLDAAQLATAFLPAPTKLAGKVGKAGVIAGKIGVEAGSESLEEGYQTSVQQQALGDDKRNALAQMFVNPSEGMKESMAIGGLLGAGMGGIGAINDVIPNQSQSPVNPQEVPIQVDYMGQDLPELVMAHVAENLPAEQKTIVAQSIENHMDQGSDEATATQKAMDELAETEEGKSIVAASTQVVANEVQKRIRYTGSVNQLLAQRGNTAPEIIPEQQVLPNGVDASQVQMSIPNQTGQVSPQQEIVPKNEQIVTPEQVNGVTRQIETEKNKPISVYRGYASGENAKDANLTRPQTFDEFLSKINKKEAKQKYQPLDVEYYTESPDVAKSYANQDQVVIDNLINNFHKTPEEAQNTFKTLIGREPVGEGIVKKHTIKPSKVLDLSDLGETPTTRELINSLLKAEGNDVPNWKRDWPHNVTPEIERYNQMERNWLLNKISEDDIVEPWRLMRSYNENDESAQAFVQWMKDNGYDAMRYAENGTNHYAVLPSETKSLVSDMKAEQVKVEPYGLNRDMGRLNEAENANRQKMLDQADYNEYADVKFKKESPEYTQLTQSQQDEITRQHDIPWNEMKNTNKPDLSIVGANKIVDDGLTDYDSWSKAMIAESGEDVVAKLPELWEKSNGLASFYREKTATGQKFANRTGKDYVDNQLPSGIEYKQATDAERQGWHDEWAGKETGAKQGNLFREAGNDLQYGQKGISESEGAIPDNQGNITGREQIEAPVFIAQNEAKIKNTPEEIKEQLKDASGITGFKTTWAPQALNRKPFKLANDLAEAITGKSVITFNSLEKAHGMTIGDQIFLNNHSRQPMVYIASHEITHSMEASHPEHYAQLKQIALEHIGDTEGVNYHYTKKHGYNADEVPNELTADVLAECMVQPTFWQRVREKSPELLKPILDTIDRIINIAKEQAKVPGKYEIMQYMKDVETMRDKLAVVYQDYLKVSKEGRVQIEGTESVAAKAKGNIEDIVPDIHMKKDTKEYDNPLDRLKDMVVSGTERLDNASTFDDWSKQMSEYPMSDKMAQYVYQQSQRLAKDKDINIKYKDQAVNIKLSDKAQQAVTESDNVVTPKNQELVTAEQTKPNHVNNGPVIDTTKHIVSKTTKPPFNVKNAANNAYVKVIDNVQRLNHFDKFVQEKTGKVLKPTEQSYKLALNSRGADQIARTILEDNLVDSKGNVIGGSLKSLMEKVPKGQEKAFEDYMIHRHSPSWTSQDRKVFPDEWGVTPEISAEKVQSYERLHPEFKTVGDDLVKWQRDMGQAWLVDTGILTPDAWKVFAEKYPDYVPMQRQMTELEQGGGYGNAKRGYANQSNPVKKATGSQRPIISPVESIIEHVDRYVKTAKRNQVMTTVIDSIKKDPEAFSGWADIVPTKATRDTELNDLLESGDVDGLIAHLEKPWDEIQTQRKGLDKANVITGIVNGEKVHVRVNDAPLLEALTNLTPKAGNVVVEGFRQATRAMKLFTTGINPMFSIARNMPRDYVMGYIGGSEANPLRYTWEFVDALARVVTNEKYHPDKFYQDYKAMGGGHSSSIASDRNILAESKARIQGTKTAKQKANAVLSPLERLANATETVPRLPEYIRTVKKGGNTLDAKTEALFQANDVTVNFNKRGEWGKEVDAFVPYLNAALQGIEKLYRLYKENPKEALAKSFVSITVPSIGLYLANRDDPDYKKLSSWIKDNNFCIAKGDGTFIKIAKPREAGIAFGSLPERALRKWADDDPDGFKHFAAAWKTNFMPPTRSILAPINDIRANKNFMDTPIVPGYLQGRSPELQYDDTTSAPAKAIGALTSSSPKKIDYLASSYGGVLSDVVLPAASQGKGQNIAQRVAEPIKRGVIADPIYSNDTTNDFYELRSKMQTAANDFKATNERTENYNPALLRRFNSDATRISEINKKIRNINSNKAMSYDQKQASTKRLKEQAVKIADRAMERAK